MTFLASADGGGLYCGSARQDQNRIKHFLKENSSFVVLKGDEFNGDNLSNAVANFFHNFAIVLLFLEKAGFRI